MVDSAKFDLLDLEMQMRGLMFTCAATPTIFAGLEFAAITSCSSDTKNDLKVLLQGITDPVNRALLLAKFSKTEQKDMLSLMDAQKTADTLSAMTTANAKEVITALGIPSAKAADLLSKMDKKSAASLLGSLTDKERSDLVKVMPIASLLKILPVLSIDALYGLDPNMLLAKLKTVNAVQLTKNKIPFVDPTTVSGRVVLAFGNVSIYLTRDTKKFVWTSVVHSPDPIDQVLAMFTGDGPGVNFSVVVVGAKKPNTAPALPNGLVAKEYFYVTPDVEPELIKQGLISFFVEKSWLEENGYHRWSVVLHRLNSVTNEWQALEAQLVSEDDTKLHYNAPVPGFSLFAITGGIDPAGQEFTVADLQVSPAVAVEGSSVTVTAAITNTSARDQTFPINLVINLVVDDSQSVTVAAGATETVMFTTVQAVGTYEVRVDRSFGSFTVEAQVATPTATPVPAATPAPTATKAPAPAPTATKAPAPTATKAPAPAPTATKVPAPAPTAVATIEPTDGDDGGSIGLIIGIIIAVLVLGGGIAFFTLRSKGPRV